WAVVSVGLFGCGSSSVTREGTGRSASGSSTTGSIGSTGGIGTTGGSTGSIGATSTSGGTTGSQTHTDFASQPVVLDGLPYDLPTLFEAADGGSASAGPCLSEPTLDAL